MKSISLKRSNRKEESIQLKSYQNKTVTEGNDWTTKQVAKEDKEATMKDAGRVGGGGGGGGGHENYVHCAMLGDGMVGKTCLTLSYTQHVFTDRYTATVFDNYPVPVSIEGEDFVVNLFDSAGQSDFESLRTTLYNISEVLVLCFSVCERESFDSVLNCWLPEIHRHTKGRKPLLLVGTQIDLRTSTSSSSSSFSSSSSALSQEEVSLKEGNQLAKKIRADCYIECSALSEEGVQQVFQSVISSALRYRKKKNTFLRKLFGH